MKNAIAVMAILMVVVGCNTTKKSAIESIEVSHEERSETNKRMILKTDTIFRHALIVIDSAEIEIPITPKDSNKKGSAKLKSRRIIIDASNKKQSISIRIDTTTNATTIEQIKKTHSEEKSKSSCGVDDWIILILITIMIALLILIMHKK